MAILSIPLPAPRTQIDEHLETEDTLIEKQKRLTSLLSLQNVPTRASLIRDMLKHGVLNFVHPELKDMYEWLEVEFHPLRLSGKMEEGIKFVEKLDDPNYTQYMPALRDVTVVRLLQQVSQVYQTIELKRFISLAPSMDPHRLEKIIVNAARNNDVQVHIEHKLQALTFGTDLNFSTNRATTTLEADVKTNIIQKMPNEQIRNQLISISRALYSCMDILCEKQNRENNEKLRQEIAQIYHLHEPLQRKDVLKRKELIERYKEEKETHHKRKIQQDAQISKEEQAKRNDEEESRRKAEAERRRKEEASEREIEEHRKNVMIAIKKLRETDIGRKIADAIPETDLYTYDPESLNALHIDAVIQYSREQKEKLKVQYKKVDYLVRALHEAELPLLKEFSKQESEKRIQIQREERVIAIEKRDRLVRMEDEKNKLLQSIQGERHNEYVQRLKEYESRLEAERKKNLEKIRKEYVEQKKKEWHDKKQQKKQQKQEEIQQRKAEKQRAIEEQEREKRRAKDNEQRAKQDEAARKQQARMEEIERKLEQQNSQTKSSSIRETRSTAGADSTHSGSGGRADA